MFTEIPADGVYPKDVHLLANAILKRQVRGGLVDGPVYRRIFQSLKGVGITEPDPLAAFQDEQPSITTTFRITQPMSRQWTARLRQFYFGRFTHRNNFPKILVAGGKIVL